MYFAYSSIYAPKPDVNNILVQPAPVGDYEIQTRIIFTPTQNFQISGLEIYQDDSNVLTLGRAYCDASISVCVGNGIYFDYSENGNLNGDNFHMATAAGDATWLKVVRHANDYTGYVSMNGTDWTLVGTHTVTIAPTLVGLKVSNQVSGDTEIPADFDYFTLVDNTNRIYLPLIIR